MTLRVGHGIDVHAFAPGRSLVLGGVSIEFDRGLIGHSDADVLTHAVMDAILGAAGFEDIGVLFPDTDATFKDANSLGLLAQVMAQVSASGWTVENVDCCLLIEAPKISPYRSAIRSNLAACLGVAVECCTVKATTMEKLGFIGREEGVVASCTALLSKA